VEQPGLCSGMVDGVVWSKQLDTISCLCRHSAQPQRHRGRSAHSTDFSASPGEGSRTPPRDGTRAGNEGIDVRDGTCR